MATVFDSPHFLTQAGAYEVASHHVGKSVVDVIQNLLPGGKKRRGDYYLDRADSLIEQNYEKLRPQDQDLIVVEWQK